MPLLTVIVVLVVIGFLLYVLNAGWIPLDPRIRQIITGLILLVVVLWILTLFVPALTDVRVGPVR